MKNDGFKKDYFTFRRKNLTYSFKVNESIPEKAKKRVIIENKTSDLFPCYIVEDLRTQVLLFNQWLKKSVYLLIQSQLKKVFSVFLVTEELIEEALKNVVSHNDKLLPLFFYCSP